MRAPFCRWMLCIVVALGALCACGPRETPLPPSPEPQVEDPVLKVQTPGAYGVPGGDQILLPSRQCGVLTYGNSFSVRLLDPSTLTVASISGLPLGLRQGQRVSFLYRLSTRGRTLATQAYENVQVLQLKDQMAWLKADDNTFFVISLL